MQTAIWVGVLRISGMLEGVINIWAFRYAQSVERLLSVEFAIFVALGTVIYMFSIGLFLASMVGAPDQPGFPFIWPVSVVFFTAVVMSTRGDIHLARWEWILGTLLALMPLLCCAWGGEKTG